MGLKATHFYRDDKERFVVSEVSVPGCYTKPMLDDEKRQHWLDNPGVAEKEIGEIVDKVLEKTSNILKIN